MSTIADPATRTDLAGYLTGPLADDADQALTHLGFGELAGDARTAGRLAYWLGFLDAGGLWLPGERDGLVMAIRLCRLLSTVPAGLVAAARRHGARVNRDVTDEICA